MNYSEWLKTVPVSLTGDPLWTVEAYRLALFAADVAWHDVTRLMHRLGFHTQVIRLLLAMVPQQRGQALHEDAPPYNARPNTDMASPSTESTWANLLTHVPLP